MAALLRGRLGRFEDWVASALMAAILVVLALQVGSRVIGAPLSWTEEVARFCLMWLIMLGATIAVRDGTHFDVDVLPAPKTPRAKAIARLVVDGSILAVALIFTQLFSRDYGMVNYVLSEIGLHKVDWEAGNYSSWIALSVMVMWRWTGYNALIYLAGMQAIPFELYESAAMDGASRWRQFRSITVPMLRPTILFTVIVSTIGALQIFGEPLLFNQSQTPETGGSQHQFQVMAVYTYQTFLGNGKYGYGSAISWAMFLVIVVIVGINLALVRRLRGVEGS